MRICEAVLPEFDQEMANTRKTLERLPEDKLAWKPHEKSMTMGRLAGHVVELVGWANTTITTDSLNVTMDKYQPIVATSRQQILDLFDKSVKESRAAIEGASDEHMLHPWTLSFNGQTVFTMPRAAVLRVSCFNHLIHHRAQLGVYLRLNNVPVPALYGPSADEGAMGASA